MRRVELWLDSSQDMQKVEEAVRTVQFMMPRIELQFALDQEKQTVQFTCDSVDNLTLSSAVLMLRTLLRDFGQVR